MRAASLVIAIGVAAAVAGCAGSGPREPFRYFVLEAPATVPVSPGASAPAPIDATLIVLPTVAASFYATQEMAYSKVEGTRAYYQFSSWTEPPDTAVTHALVERIDAARLFRSVALAGSGARGSLVLSTQLLEIYHDASSSPGTAKIVVAAELRDTTRHSVVARRTFNAAVPATSFDAGGAVQGFRAGLGRIGDEMTAWLASVAPAK